MIQSEPNKAVNHQHRVLKEGHHLQTPQGKSSFLAFAHVLHSSSPEPQSISAQQMISLFAPPAVFGKVCIYLADEVSLILNSNGDIQPAYSIKELISVHGLGHAPLLEELQTNGHLHLHTERRMPTSTPLETKTAVTVETFLQSLKRNSKP